MTTSAVFQAHLQEHAPRYFGDVTGDHVEVQLHRLRQRINSTLFEFDIGASSVRHTVFVKIPFSLRTVERKQEQSRSGHDRPRLAPKPPVYLKHHHEYVTLCAIERHWRESGDERFAAVRMLDLLPDHSALVMEKSEARSLSRIMPSASRIARRPCSVDLPETFYRAGVWLRVFHEMPALEHTRARGALRDEFVTAVDRLAHFLAVTEHDWFFDHLKEVVSQQARRILPERLPLGLSHGDYAPRNVLVDDAGRVQVIDTMGRWRAPRYEDVGRFLCALHASVPQVWSKGWAYSEHVLQEFERQFLCGYFGDEPIPEAQVRIFECLALLDRWASLVHSRRTARGAHYWVKKARYWWWQPFFRRYMTRILARFIPPGPPAWEALR